MKTTTMKTTTMTMEPTTTNNETTKTNVRLPTHPFLSWTSKSSSLQGQFHSDCSQDRSLRFVRYGGDGLIGLVAETDVNTKCQVLDWELWIVETRVDLGSRSVASVICVCSGCSRGQLPRKSIPLDCQQYHYQCHLHYICPNWHMYFSELTNVFVWIEKCICPNWKVQHLCAKPITMQEHSIRLSAAL